MKKLFMLALCIALFAGCSTSTNGGSNEDEKQPEPIVYEGVNVLVPSGAPALSVAIDIANSELNKYTITSGADMLTTELAKADSEYDIIVAPINAGAKLISLGKSSYKLAAVLTWGNLYLVGSEDATENDAISAFGEAAVPGAVLKTIVNKKGMTNDITFLGAVSDAQAELLGGKTKVALLAEPAVTATIAKAKQNDKNLKIIMSLQEAWKEIYGSNGYPQAAVFVKQTTLDEKPEEITHYLDTISSFIQNPDMDAFEVAVDARLSDIGVPSGKIARNSYERQNIRYVKASEVKKEIQNFLDVFNVSLQDDAYLN